jgi:phage-related protein
MGNLSFGWLYFDTYGIEVDGIDQWVKPERDTTSIHVPGRSGDLIIDNGCWKNVPITYHCHIKDGWETHFKDFVKNLYQLQGGYFSLVYDSEIPGNNVGGYRMAEFKGGITPNIWDAMHSGVFDLTFNCKPLLYVGGSVSADFSHENVTKTFDNPYGMTAIPKLQIVEAYAGARIYINGGYEAGTWVIDVAPHSQDFIEIDCELETIIAYDEMDEEHAVDASSLVTITPDEDAAYAFPALSPVTGLYITAYHEVWNDDPDDPQLLATYTGYFDLDKRFVRI